jgi:hypothetical protein
MTLIGIIDRIEDDKIVVINIEKNKGLMYLPKNLFNFKIYEGLWLKIEISADENKTEQTRIEIKKLQQKLLSKSKKSKIRDL